MDWNVEWDDAIASAVDELSEEIVEFTRELIRLPTVNPPGECYEQCAHAIGDRFESLGFRPEYLIADGSPEHSPQYPRINVLGRRDDGGRRPRVHLNGHFDVVPAGDGWSRAPFGGELSNGRIFGRGASDMKSGISAALFACEGLRRAGFGTLGSLELSATVDEESGGFAGAAWLAENGILTSDRVDHVIIPEPFGPSRICTGHRGVYWLRIRSIGRIAHGSMPHLGTNAIEQLGPLLEALRTRLQPALAERLTAIQVVPEESRRATLNINSILGGQAGMDPQTPCVAESCELILDRRFLLEEGIESARREIEDLVREVEGEVAERRYEIDDLMIVEPVQTELDDPLVLALRASSLANTGADLEIVASPGTYDHKHVSRIGGIHSCVAYGPGPLEEAHQPDESCSVEDLIVTTRILAGAIARLVGIRRS